jgi:hypothetical protein
MVVARRLRKTALDRSETSLELTKMTLPILLSRHQLGPKIATRLPTIERSPKMQEI